MRTFFLVVGFFVLQFSVTAKSLSDYIQLKKDTNYIQSYYNDLILRVYSGEKTQSLELDDLNNPYRLKYLPNGYFNLGVGVNFKSFGLSLATKIPVFLESEVKHGETKRFGIQSYIYSNKFSVDLLTSFLKGYYLSNSYLHLKSYPKDLDYQRPDIASANIGISVNYIFNNTRFSYKAAFSDTEKQLKSAGSLLAGGSIFSYQTTADSALVPREIDATHFMKSRDLTKSGVLAFNANLGYAYSLVFLKRGIATFSYMLGSGVQDNSFDSEFENEINKWRFSFNYIGRIAIGYRFKQYFARFVLIQSDQYTNLKFNDLSVVNGTNFIQVSLGKKIFSKRK